MTSRRREQASGILAVGLISWLLGCSSPTSTPEVSDTTAAGATAVGTTAATPEKAPERLARASGAEQSTVSAELTWADVPVPMKPCFSCHRPIVETYLEHGMARSLGPLGEPPIGIVENPVSGNRYELRAEGDAGWLDVSTADGGSRLQRLVGRIGAGIFDTSWVGAEVDLATGDVIDRLFFMPVETITDHGHELSPFELVAQSAGADLALEEGCLTCHTTDRLEKLPGASVASGAADAAGVFPPNALGADAFEELSPLTCDACHGDTDGHVQAMTKLSESQAIDVALPRLADLAAGAQRDICARCHLQGDARIDLVSGQPRRGAPLSGQVPVLVPSQPGEGFRFVGQNERLALSACFRASPEMTCTTCHDPHVGVAAQGTASFDSACIACHDRCSRPEELKVPAVTGEPPRTEVGCIDCHVRRSQPYDLPHVRSADHFVRRRISVPEEVPYRQFANLDEPVEIFDDGRLAGVLATSGGQRWASGALAMGLTTLGRLEEAAAHFAAFPEPGSEDARRPTAPADLVAFETFAPFHQVRALVLMATGRFEAALAAFGDALALDPLLAGARLGRAQLRFDLQDVVGALEDTQAVIDAYPRAEQPWELRASMAERLRRPDLASSAFEAYVRIWPSNPTVWTKLGLLRRQSGDAAGALQALEQAQILSPSLRLPGAQAR